MLHDKHDKIRAYVTNLDDSTEEQAKFKASLLDLLNQSQQLSEEIAALINRQGQYLDGQEAVTATAEQ
ncbi:hypothetical protein [Pelotalea chapellei]|uniref:Uncharacterized protein n=1 Tax=Pelotalea chapellei TaxID=44671 RepID=A0ABS5UDA4_9BACT|nr:hypothetical protein [Pelotalea chapellei]MBT1073615.1 hypothetical protein [Pelotalea chapellei]